MKLNLKLYEKLRKYTSTRISKKYIYIEIILRSYFMHIHKTLCISSLESTMHSGL